MPKISKIGNILSFGRFLRLSGNFSQWRGAGLRALDLHLSFTQNHQTIWTGGGGTLVGRLCMIYAASKMVSVFSSNVEISYIEFFRNIARMLRFYFMVLLFWRFSRANTLLGNVYGWREHLTMSFVHIPYTYMDNLKSHTAPTNDPINRVYFT